MTAREVFYEIGKSAVWMVLLPEVDAYWIPVNSLFYNLPIQIGNA